MPNDSKTCRDTQFFSRLSPAVFQTILDVIPAIGAVLNWEPLATAFLADVLRQVALTGDPLIKKHLDFARALWGDELSPVAAARRIGRAISSLKKCQLLSGFLAVWIDSGGKSVRDGEAEYFDTTYRLRDFFDVFSEIQKLAGEQDLMSLPKHQRKITLLAIVQSVCDARGYQKCPKRSRQKPEKTTAKKSDPLPCRCNCTSCQLCFAKLHEKSATGSEANGRGARIEELRRQPNEDFGAELQKFVDFFGRHLREIGEVGKEFAIAVKRAHTALEIEEQDAREMITTENKREGVRQYIELVGGQPK